MVFLSRDSQVGVSKSPKLGLSWLWSPIILRADLRSKCGLKQSCSPLRELSNGMSHAICKQVNRVDSRGYGNMSTLAWTFIYVVSYILLELSIFGHGSCFGPAFSKACQYVCNDTNVFIGFCEVNLKTTQSTLQKQSHGLKSLTKKHNEW
jgi:hypothetical protein